MPYLLSESPDRKEVWECFYGTVMIAQSNLFGYKMLRCRFYEAVRRIRKTFGFSFENAKVHELKLTHGSVAAEVKSGQDH